VREAQKREGLWLCLSPPLSACVKGGVKLDHWGGGKVDQFGPGNQLAKKKRKGTLLRNGTWGHF